MPLYGSQIASKPRKYTTKHKHPPSFIELRTDQLKPGMRIQTPRGLLPIASIVYVGIRYEQAWYSMQLKYKGHSINASTFGYTEWTCFIPFQ